MKHARSEHVPTTTGKKLKPEFLKLKRNKIGTGANVKTFKSQIELQVI